MKYINIIQDDQQILVRYAIEYPDIVSIDSKNDFFFTAYREFNHFQLLLHGNMSLDIISNTTSYLNIPLIHFNNMKSYQSYFDVLFTNINNIMDEYYSSSITTVTIQALRYYYLEEYKLMKKILQEKPFQNISNCSDSQYKIACDLMNLKNV